MAAYRAGQLDAALEHLAYVREQFPLNPLLARQVETWQREWRTARGAGVPSIWRGEIQLDAGYDDNVNAGLSRSQITLTIPGGQAILPLASSYRPRGDSFTQLGISLWRSWQLAEGSLHPLLQVRYRQMGSERDYDQVDLQGGLMYQQVPDEDGRSWQAGLLLQHYRLGGSTLGNTQRVVLQRLQQQEQCRLAWGGEVEERSYPGLPLDGRIFWLDAGLACQNSAALMWSASLRTGWERPEQSSRPGGGNRQWELNLQGSYRFDSRLSLDWRWQYSLILDQEGYSPLLSENERRRLRQQFLGVGLQRALGEEWLLRLGLELQRQDSNLQIFEQNSSQIGVSLRRAF